jgi:hypothetical protein
VHILIICAQDPGLEIINLIKFVKGGGESVEVNRGLTAGDVDVIKGLRKTFRQLSIYVRISTASFITKVREISSYVALCACATIRWPGRRLDLN